MQQPPRQRTSTTPPPPPALEFDKKLEAEEGILDSLLMALARGQVRPETWDRLHEAAQRDGRVAELAFAYEAVSQGKRLKMMAPAVIAEFLFRAGTFFAGPYGDEIGARAYLERALAALPTHAAAFERMEGLLTKHGELRRVAELYTTGAQHRARPEQIALLRRAASLYEQVPGGEEKAVEIHQQLLRLDPSDGAAREVLEARYLRQNRHRDVARLLEQALSVEPGPPEEEQLRLRLRLIELYDGRLQEPERAMPHVEAVLAREPSSEPARRVANKLLNVRGIAARAAAALADAFEAWGSPEEVARYLAVELEHTRGPKRFTILRRIGVLRQDRLNDLAGACEAFEQAMALDPSDDQVRERYAGLCVRLGRALDGARTLTRVGTAAKDPPVRARLNAAIGELLRAGGDLKRARATFVSVLSTPHVDDLATLRASHALAEIYQQENDLPALADVLQRIAVVDPDPTRRLGAAEHLAALASGPLADRERAVAAWRGIVSSQDPEAEPLRERALAALEPLYEEAGDWGELAFVLEERAKRTEDADEARRLAFRAAFVLSTETTDGARASAAWKALVERFGPSRDALLMWIPLLEAQRQWPDLALALTADADLAAEDERAPIWARLGHVRLQRTRETELAIQTFQLALAADPAEKTSRATLERLLSMGDNRLSAAAVLEPVYRVEGNAGGLLRVLEIKAQLEPEVAERLGALGEAMRVAETTNQAPRALEFAGRALAEAVAHEQPIGPWQEEVERLAAGTDPKRRAALLSKALGDKAVSSPEMLLLARRAGEAMAQCGDVSGALSAFRRALAFDPSSGELIARVDELLREQGNPEERVALYRAALEQGVDGARRRELLHAIGAIERFDLKEPTSAITAYQTALRDDPEDREAVAALVDLFSEVAAWTELCDLLERVVARAPAEEARRTRAQLAEVAAAHGERARAERECKALLADPATEPGELDAVERVAAGLGDAEIARALFARRAQESGDPREQIQWLEKLAALQLERLDDRAGGGDTWKQAGRLAGQVGDDELAGRIWSRVRELAPGDVEAATALVALYEHGERWPDLPPLFDVLLAHTTEPRARVALFMRVARLWADRLNNPATAVDAVARAFELDPRDREVLAQFERLTMLAGTAALFGERIDLAVGVATDPILRADLLMAKARVAAMDGERFAEATQALRAVLGTPELDEGRTRAAVQAFDDILAWGDGHGEDRRWLCQWRYEHAADAERVPALTAWAEVEETQLGDKARALELYRRVVMLDPENADAMGAVARLALANGDVEGAIGALVGRRDRSEGVARRALDLEIAGILLERTERLDEALGCVAAVFEAAPHDTAALELATRCLGQSSTRARAVEILERAEGTAEDPEVRARILSALLDGPPSASPPEQRRDWYTRLLDHLQSHGQTERAHEVVLKAAEEMPTVAALWDRAEELARDAKRPDEVAALFQRVLAQTMAREDALELGQRAVAFYEEWFEEPERVVAILERILEIDPTESWAFDRLKLLFDAAERWDDLFALYDRALLAAGDDTKVELLEDAAQIAKDFAKNTKRAIGYLEQLLALRPGNARLSASLERLYERHGCHRELIALLTGQLGQLEHDAAQESRARMARLWLDELADATNALLVVEDIVAREPGGEPKGVDVADLLERVLAKAPATAEMRESVMPPETGTGAGLERARRESLGVSGGPKRTLVRQRAAALLKERYAAPGREEQLVRILEVELEAVKSIRERVKRHLAIAQLYGQLGDEGAAMEHYTSLVVLEPDVAEHRTQLAEIAARTGRHERFAEVLVAAADDCTDETLRVELLMQAADTNAGALGAIDRAIDLLFRVLLVSPITEAALLTACRRLDPLLETAQRPRERLDVLERLALLEPESAVRRDVLGTAARLATTLGDNDRAVWAWEERLKLDAKDADALDGLVALLESEHRWRPLIEVLRQRATAGAPGEDRRADLVRVATILSDELGETDEAIASWRDVEEEFGDSDESTRALAMLLRSARKWNEMAQLLERAAARTEGALRARLLRELGDVQREHLDQADRAVGSYKGALEADPRNEEARAGLRTLLARPEHRAAAVTVLLDAYRATDEWRAALELTEHRLTTASGDAAKVAVLLEAAELAEKRAADTEAAFVAVRRAFLLTPDDARIEKELLRLAELTRQWRPLAEAQREALEAIDAAPHHAHPSAAPAHGRRASVRPEEKRPGAEEWTVRLRYRMGEVLETRLEDPRAALGAYLRVACDAPRDLDATRATIRVGGKVARWDAVARVVVESARARERLEPEVATAVEEATSGGASWDAATAALATAFAERNDLPPLVARDLEARLAAWHRDQRSDPDAAEAAYTRALGHDPSNAELLAALSQLQRRQKGRPLVDTLLRLSSATGGDLDLLREAAEIATQNIHDRALAKSILERLLKIGTERWLGEEDADGPVTAGSPLSPARTVEWALRELVTIHQEEGDAERVLDLLSDTARLPFEAETSRQMRHEAARIAMERLGDADRAIALLSALFEENPEDAEAVRRLVELYQARGRTAELLDLKRRQIAAARMPSRRIGLRLEAAPLMLSSGDVAGCVEALRENLGEDPRDAATVRELVRVLEREQRFVELGTLLAEQAKLAAGAGERGQAAELWSRAAEVAEQRMGEVETAIAHYERVIALEPRPAALAALARLSAARGDHVAAAEHLERLRAAAEPGERAAITLRLADALVAAGRDDLARERLEEASESDPAAEAVRAQLAEIYRAKQEWRPLAALLTRGAEHAPDKAARLARLREAADLYRTRCEDPAAAVPLLERASDLDPEDRTIRLALGDALGAAGRFEEARSLLRALIDGFGGRRPKDRAPVHYHLARLDLALGDRARALVELDQATKIDPANPEILRALAELARDDGQTERAERSYRALLAVLRRHDDADGAAAITRSEVLLELSALADREGEKERAREILESALEVAAGSNVESRRLEKALRARGAFATMVRALEARLARTPDGPDAAEGLGDLAEVLDEKLGRKDDALKARLRAVGLAPGDAAVHDAALALARREGASQLYVDHVTELAKAAEERSDAPLAGTLLARLGGVVELELQDDARAARLYERAHEHGARSAEVLRAMDRVYERLGDSAAQARVLAARVEQAGGEAPTDALFRLATLRLRAAETVDEGCELLVAALDRESDIDRAESILGGAVAAFPGNERLLALYEHVGRTPGHEKALVDALTRRWELIGNAEPLVEAVDVARGVGDAATAETLLRRLLDKASPTEEDRTHRAWALSTLAELRLAAGDVAEAVARKREAAEVAAPEVGRRLWFEVAALAAEKLADLPAAARAYEGLLARDPADREAWEPLLDVYRRLGASEQLAALVARVVEHVEDLSERSRLRLERVRVMMKDLGLGDEAAAVLREIVDEDPAQVEAGILLGGILEKSGRTEELAQLLAQQLDAAKDRSDAASVAALSRRLGALLEATAPEDAKSTYYAGLEWAPEDRALLSALVALAEKGGDPAERADVMERLLALEKNEPAEKLALELAQVRSDSWDEEGAERALEIGFRAYPASARLRDRLETAYRERQSWDKLAELYLLDARARTEDHEKVSRLCEAASLYRHELSDPAGAARVLRDARACDPEDPSLLDDLIDTLAEAGDHAGALAELSGAVDGSEGQPNHAPLLARRARLKRDAGDEAGALADMERAHHAGGDTYARDLADYLDKAGQRAADMQDVAGWRALRLRLARLLPRIEDLEGARAILADVLRSDPKDREALHALAELEEGSQRWEAASIVYRRLVALEEGEAVVETALRLANACERAGRLGDARGGLERARVAAPGNEPLRRRLEQLYEQTGAFQELAEMCLEDARAALDVAGRYGHLVRAGSLLLSAGDPQGAIAPLDEARALRPTENECILLLADALILSGRAGEATELLQTTVAAHKGRRSRELGALHQRLAKVARAVGDQPSELQWLSSALEMDAQNGVIASELATVAMTLGNLDVATRALRAITMLKTTAPLSKGLAYQYLGEIASHQGDRKRAVLLLKRAIDEEPGLASARALYDALHSAD